MNLHKKQKHPAKVPYLMPATTSNWGACARSIHHGGMMETFSRALKVPNYQQNQKWSAIATMEKKQEDFSNPQANVCSRTECFDFKKWAALAATDKEKFEQERQRYIQSFIENYPSSQQHRLWQLQWKIDAIRKVSSNPLASCVKLYEMLLDQVYGTGGLLDNLMIISGQKSFHEVHDNHEKKAAKILPFKLTGESA